MDTNDQVPEWDRDQPPSAPGMYVSCGTLAAQYVDGDPDYETNYRALCTELERDPISLRLAVRTFLEIVASTALSTQGQDVAGARLWRDVREAQEAEQHA